MNLQAWGVRRITLVDNGRVAMSNPLRQSLYTLDDCLNGGEFKATAAVNSLKRIFPAVVINFICLSSKTHGLSQKFVNFLILFIHLFLLSGSKGCCHGYTNAWTSCS